MLSKSVFISYEREKYEKEDQGKLHTEELHNMYST